MPKPSPITFTKVKLDKGRILYMIDIEDLDTSIKSFIDSNIIHICKGTRRLSIDTVKKELLIFLKAKKDSTLLTGAVSEFFIHLFLNQQKFKQEFLYFNLEEGSIKKGFDGYYTKKKKQWVLESKSGILTKKNIITHPDKIGEAYRGLKAKIEGMDRINNPWENAYHHASHCDVKASKNIREIINDLAEDYTNENYRKIDEFNIIPCSTIFLSSAWSAIDQADLISKINLTLRRRKFKRIKIICLNKKSVKSLIKYLEE